VKIKGVNHIQTLSKAVKKIIEITDADILEIISTA